MANHYYCPYCGTTQLKKNVFCIKCKQPVTLAESKYDSEYYREQSQIKYGDYTHWYEFLLLEIKTNPLFNESLHKEKIDYNKVLDTVFKPKPETINKPKCPTCGSTNIAKISNLKRATHGYAFGLFSKTARSQFECKNCGYKW